MAHLRRFARLASYYAAGLEARSRLPEGVPSALAPEVFRRPYRVWVPVELGLEGLTRFQELVEGAKGFLLVARGMKAK